MIFLYVLSIFVYTYIIINNSNLINFLFDSRPSVIYTAYIVIGAYYIGPIDIFLFEIFHKSVLGYNYTYRP